MAQRIVDPLEAIQVQVQQYQRLLATFAAQQRILHRLMETAPVQQPGQRVGHGLEFQLLMQVTHFRHVQHRHHHCLLLRRQRRAGQRYRHLLAPTGAQNGIVLAPRLAPAIRLVHGKAQPGWHMGLLQETEETFALQLSHRCIQQPGNGRVGILDHTVFAHHQNALGGVIQHRGIKSAGQFQVMAQALQGTAIALVLEQGLHLGLEDVRVKGLEQVVDRTTGVAFQHRVGRMGGGRQKDNRRHARTLAATHQARHLETVHARHAHVQQHQVDVVGQQ